MLLTPPMSAEEVPVKRRKVQVEDEDEDEESINNLLESYAPLSSLPTPPVSKETSPRPFTADGPTAEPDNGRFMGELSLRVCRIA